MKFKPKDLVTYAEKLNQGAIGILPFDTLYGLTCTLNEHAIKRISSLKGRDASKPFIIIVSSWDQAASFAELPPSLPKKGPVTYILNKKKSFPTIVGFSLPTVAIRCADYTPLSMMLNLIGEPIISTSVNTAGEPALTQLSLLSDTIKSQLDFVCDTYTPLYNEPSTIIDITGSQPKLIRQGVLV